MCLEGQKLADIWAPSKLTLKFALVISLEKENSYRCFLLYIHMYDLDKIK